MAEVYSAYEEVLAEREADHPTPVKTTYVPPNYSAWDDDDSSTDWVDMDWRRRQEYLDLLDDQDLLSYVKKECLHTSQYYGNVKVFDGEDDRIGEWQSGLVCKTCGTLVSKFSNDAY